MTSTGSYLAWNGETYQGVPPDGWHLASDGRWWSPGTGPVQSGQHSPPSLAANILPPSRVPTPLPTADSPWWRKTWGSVVVIFLGLSIVAAIGVGTAGNQVVNDRERSERIQAASQMTITSYRSQATEIFPFFQELPDQLILDIATTACDVASNQGSHDRFVAEVEEAWTLMGEEDRRGYNNDMDGFVEIFHLALGRFCPEVKQQLDQAS